MKPEKYIDPAIERKSKIINDALINDYGFPLPSVIEISESGTCNRKCGFCPRSDPDFEDVNEFIAVELLEKLANELAIFNYSGIFLFSGFVEPLLDKNIYDHISLVRRTLPNARIELVTNGDVLNPERLNKLFFAGLSTLLISVYDGEAEARRFYEMCKNANLSDDQFVIRHRYLPEEKSFGITLSNRAGMMKGAEYSIAPLTEPLKTQCSYPHYTFFMDYKGDVLLCAHDWGKKLIVGNLKVSSFLDIWLGQKYNHARKMLATAKREFQPCLSCDVSGGLMGLPHMQAWEKYYLNNK